MEQKKKLVYNCTYGTITFYCYRLPNAKRIQTTFPLTINERRLVHEERSQGNTGCRRWSDDVEHWTEGIISVVRTKLDWREG